MHEVRGNNYYYQNYNKPISDRGKCKVYARSSKWYIYLPLYFKGLQFFMNISVLTIYKISIKRDSRKSKTPCYAVFSVFLFLPPYILLSTPFSNSLSLKSTVFCGVTPCSLMDVHRLLGEVFCLHIHGWNLIQAINHPEAGCMMVSCLTHSSILKMEVLLSSEISMKFYWTTRRYIPEDGTLYSHRCENFTLRLCLLELNVRGKISYTYEPAGKTIILYIFICRFLDRWREY
jgi:hypothetical protein